MSAPFHERFAHALRALVLKSFTVQVDQNIITLEEQEVLS